MSTGPAHRVTSAVEVYGYPQGHLGRLSDEEEAALKAFKKLCTDTGLYKGPKDDEFGTNDDATLLRFLRARRFNVTDAIQQFKDTSEWREANQLDTLYETIDLQQYDETRRLYPQWTGRRDRRGIPVYVFEVKHLNSKAMAAYEKSASKTDHKAKTDGKTPPKLLRLFALYENLTRFVMPLSTVLTDREFPGTPITQSNNIVDISGVGLKQFWNLRTHMQDASTLATAHYPETLDRIFIIGAPAFFPTVWGWIKRWFDPITTSKIFILSAHEMQATLESFIEPANIPKKYGGQLDFNWGDMPVYDPAMNDVLTWKDGHKDFPPGPMYWHDRGDHVELEAVGTIGGEQRHEFVATVRKTTIEREAEEVRKAAEGAASPAAVRAGTGGDLLQVPTIEEASSRPSAVEADRAAMGQPGPISFAATTEGVAALSLQDANAPAQGNGTVETPPIPKAGNKLLDPLSENVKPLHSGVSLGEESSRSSIDSKSSHGPRKHVLGKVLEKVHIKKTPSKEGL